MIILDAFVPIFTMGALFFVVPILAILAITFIILKRRKIALWLFISILIAIGSGVLGDYIMLTSANKNREEQWKEREAYEDSLQKHEDSLNISKKDSLK